MFPLEFMRTKRLWISECRATMDPGSSGPNGLAAAAGAGAAAPAGWTTTTAKRSQVQSDGSSSGPLWPLPSMLPSELMRM